MSIVKASDLAYCRFQLPDLDRAEEFLVDFGLIPIGREKGRRYFRTTDPMAYCYVIEEGPRHFLGFAFHGKSQADLEKLAKAKGVVVETIDAPGGGSRVRLKEPNGYDVDVVYGIEASPAIEVKRQAVNTGSQPLVRAGELYRLQTKRATPLKRLAHVVLGTPQVTDTIEWFKETLGTIVSDDIVSSGKIAGGPPKMHFGAFMRVDNGDEYVDHHAIFVVAYAHGGLQHVSFESQDLDAVFADHDYLKHKAKYEHLWGLGRHLLGAQVFDYWSDPFGYPHEHWADSDRLNASTPTNIWEPHEAMVSQWGEDTPDKFKVVIP